MKRAKRHPQTPVDDLLKILTTYRLLGSQRKTAKALGMAQSVVNTRIAEAEKRGVKLPPLPPGGQEHALDAADARLPRAGKVKRYLFTCAQNDTRLHVPTWENLLALAKYYDATIHVSTFTYNKEVNQFQAKRRLTDAESEANYPPEIVPYMSNERLNLTDSLTWCGELQISPTARRPLVGFESYTYRHSTIIPHTTVALKAVPAVKGEGVKLLYTTGTVTQRNYIQRREGFRAEHFHSYGALLVEVDANGSWWCRQVQQGPDGAMHDLDVRAYNGTVQVQGVWNKVRRPESALRFVADIGWGDIHAAKVDPVVAHVSWGAQDESMLNVLRPSTQHVHDILDNTPISHHTRRNPHEQFRNHVKSRRSIITELKTTAAELNRIHRPWTETRVVCSNHDRHIERWLREVDWREDMDNAIPLLEFNLKVLKAIAAGDDRFYIVEDALRACGATDRGIRFMRQDEKDVILPDVDGGIETVHGDKGANGAKGSVAGIARVSRKTNMADKHGNEIMDYAYCGGMSGLLDQGYNEGYTSWTQSHTVTYVNGTRAIVAVWRGKWRA